MNAQDFHRRISFPTGRTIFEIIPRRNGYSPTSTQLRQIFCAVMTQTSTEISHKSKRCASNRREVQRYGVKQLEQMSDAPLL
jgi:hypothetical protein